MKRSSPTRLIWPRTLMVMCTLSAMGGGAWSFTFHKRRRPCAAAGRRRAHPGIGASSRMASKESDAVPPRLAENALFHIERARGDGASRR